MALAALILTSDDEDAGAIRPAELKIAGQPLFAYQIRMAHAAGAAHIVALVDQMPATLAMALDQLREDGIPVEIARDARDAADRIHPDEQLLVIARGMVPDADALAQMARRTAPGLLCAKGKPPLAGFERIDAEWQWAGLALLNGGLLRETAAMVGEWVLGPTLLRRAVQTGVERLDIDQVGSFVSYPSTQAEADDIARHLASFGDRRDGGYVTQAYRQVLNRVSPMLVRYAVPINALAWVPMALLAAAVALSIAGWLMPSLIVFLFAPIFAGHAQILSRIGGRKVSQLAIFAKARLPVLFVLLTLVGWEGSAFPDAWGPLALGLWASVGVALAMYPARTAERWFPEPEGAALLALLGLVAGQGVLALALLIAHGLAAQIARARKNDSLATS